MHISQRRSAKVLVRMQAGQSLICSHAKSMEDGDHLKRKTAAHVHTKTDCLFYHDTATLSCLSL